MATAVTTPAHSPRGFRMPDWVEAVLIVSILLISMVATRRRNYTIGKKRDYEPIRDDAHDSPSSSSSSSSSSRDSDDLEEGYGVRPDRFPSKIRTVLGCIRVRTPNSSRFAGHLHSRILQKFPFLVEMFYWALAFYFYRMTAVLSRAYFGGVRQLWDVGMNHGIAILELEAKVLGATETSQVRWIEWRIQQWFLDDFETGNWRSILLTVLNRGYSLIHIPGTVAFIAYYYATAPTHARFCNVRRMMSLLNMWAFVIFIFYPCTPPRLLPAEFGFVDTVNLEDAQSVWMSGDYVNKLAAMPSMHFGYAFCIGCVFMADSGVPQALWGRFLRLFGRSRPAEDDLDGSDKADVSEDDAILRSRSRWARAGLFLFGAWYPSWIMLEIVATANHYFLDALVAAVGVAMAWLCNRILLSLLPAEDMLLWVLRLEKPVPTTGRNKHLFVR